jgi:hypothetical protein
MDLIGDTFHPKHFYPTFKEVIAMLLKSLNLFI